MSLLDKDTLHQLIENHLNEELLRGQFGIEKENIRVDLEGRLSRTPHPGVFGSKMENPYIKTDFSESQIEMITPVFESIEETYHFLETLHDMVTLELKDEWLWPSSNPPILPEDNEIPIADMENRIENEYRLELAQKYGRKKQLLSGIHYNFSFHESLLEGLYKAAGESKDYQDFKDDVYLKVARNFLRHRWLLVYLTGASPVFHQTYTQACVQKGQHLVKDSYFFPQMNSLRNSECGYRNKKPIYVSFQSLKAYVGDLQDLIRQGDLLSIKEFYSPIRLKPSAGKEPIQALLDKGISYLEVRTTDLNPLEKTGISKEMMMFIHLFLIYMFLIKDEPFGREEQELALLNQDRLTMNGITEKLLLPDGHQVPMQDFGLQLLDDMIEMCRMLTPNKQDYIQLLEEKKQVIKHPERTFAEKVKAEIRQSSFVEYHLEKAKQYAQESVQKGYKFSGYEDLELSTQLLLKAAIKRGIQFEILDREENFVVLQKGEHKEYVKQATKTSLDSYITVLIMENKIVTKKVLRRHGIRVPRGTAYTNTGEALGDFAQYQGKAIVIKPKSTNFGLGVTIFNGNFSKEDYHKAFEIAFKYDQTVLLEEFLTGKEYRFLVMGGVVVGVLHRVPANVTGDGIHTIEQLVREKNRDPLRGHGYKTPLEVITLGDVESMFLKNQGKSINDIPKKGETVYLRENSNISTGGDSIDYTDEIHDSYKQIAIKSADVAGAVFCGVDMVIDDIKAEAGAENYGIIEINFNPAIHIHCYPYKGKNRKADEKILDLLFGK